MSNVQLLLAIAGMLLTAVAFVTTILTMVIRSAINTAKSELQVFMQEMMLAHLRLEHLHAAPPDKGD